MLVTHLALRYLRKRRAAWLALAAVTLTVMVPVVVLGVMQGVVDLMRGQVRAAESDLTVMPDAGRYAWFADSERLLAAGTADGVASSAPYILSPAFINTRESGGRSDSRSNEFTIIDGIDFEADWAMGRLGPALLHPRPDLDLQAPPLAPPERGTGFLTPDWRDHLVLSGMSVGGPFGAMPLPARKRPRPGIMLGRELIFGVGGTSPWSPLRPGATVSLIIPNGTGGTVGRVQAEISDTVGTGVIEIDRYQSWLPLPLAQRLTAMDGRLPTSEGRTEISGLRLMVEPGIGLEAMQDQLRDTLALRTQNWMQRRGNLVKSQEVFRNILVFVMICVQLVCIFIIYAVFSTLVAEKRHDIGVLLGLGASPRAITATFLLAGQIACVLGGIVGWALGWGILAGINPFGEATGIVLFPQDVFYAPSAPISWNPLLPALFLSVSMIVGLFATAIPAWRAGRIDPIDTLRSAG